MKFFTCFTFVSCVLAAALLSPTAAYNSTWGQVGPYDVILLRQMVVASSSMFRVTTRNVVYPSNGHTNYRNITAIKAIDHMRKHGGYASLINGGIGRRSVTVHLKSERGYGLNYTVEIYGR